MKLSKAVFSLLCLTTSAMASAGGFDNECKLEFSTYTANIFGNYTVKKVLYREDYRSTSAECYAQVESSLKKYKNVSTKWSHIDLTYRGDQGSILSKASFVKP